MNAPLPLPTDMGGPETPFAQAVKEYASAHNVSNAEVFRRISDETGNSVKGLSLRYYNRGNDVWRFSAA